MVAEAPAMNKTGSAEIQSRAASATRRPFMPPGRPNQKIRTDITLQPAPSGLHSGTAFWREGEGRAGAPSSAFVRYFFSTPQKTGTVVGRSPSTLLR